MSVVPTAVTDWVTDSGASNYTTSDAGNLTYICPPHINDPLSIIVGNISSLSVTSVGDMVLPGPFYLNNVLVTPDIIQNLLSVRRFTTDDLCSMKFDPFNLSVKDLSTRNVIIMCDSSGPLYTMRLPSRSIPSSSVAAPIALVALASTCHRRLRPGIDTMSKLSNAFSVVCSRRQRFQVVRLAGRAGRATSRLIAIRTTTRTINRLFKKIFRLFKKLFWLFKKLFQLFKKLFRFRRQIFRPRCRYFGFLFRYFSFLFTYFGFWFTYFGFRFTYFGFRFTYFGFLFTYFDFRFTYFGFPFRISVQRNPFIFFVRSVAPVCSGVFQFPV
jgi:hypothetical protein